MERGEVVDERFEILELAGSGGMGEVYRALDRASGEPVALKVLAPWAAVEPQLIDRFASEAGVLASLAHPGIVRYVAHGISGRRPYLAMEWLEGEDLQALLARRSTLSLHESVELCAKAAEALGYAHARGLVHRDVKPANVFLVGDGLGHPTLVDFGVAAVSDESAKRRGGEGGPLGTPGYMAPEQALGEADVGARADVFALGSLLFRCLTGRSPFEGEHLAAVLAKTLLEPAPRLKELRHDVPEPLDALVARMLSKEASERPGDGAEAAELLRASLPSERPPASIKGPALTGREQLLLTLLLLGPGDDRPRGPEAEARLAAVRAAARPFGGRVERLADGSIVMALSGEASAADQAAQAARCALSLGDVGRPVPAALVTGRGDLRGPLPVGEVIDRAVVLLERARPGEVSLDEVTAGLLSGRFDVGESEGQRRLVGASARPSGGGGRTLLGRRAPFVGREAELATLEALFDLCASSGRAGAAVVTAAAGYGKSRLLYEWLERLSARPNPPYVLSARGDPMAAGSPFGLLSQALRSAAGVLEGEPLDDRRAKLLARVGRHVAPAEAPRVAAFVGEMIGAPFDEGPSVQLRAAREDPMLMGDQMLRAWEDFLSAECGARPLVLVLEDLHWGDFPTVKYVDSALRNLRHRPLLVVAAARPEVHELFPGLWAERGAVEVRLGELSVEAGARLVLEVLGPAVTPEEARQLASRASGNALYLEELIRAQVEGHGGETPGTVLAMVQARLSSLELGQRRALRAASVFGQVFWTEGVAALLGGRSPEETDGQIEELVRGELVERRPGGKFPGQAELAFRHALVRDAAYASLTDDDRALGHRLAGLWLERAGEGDSMVLGEHFERGREPGRAVAFYRRAAEHALEGNDLEAVVARAERGVRLGADGEIGGALRLLQAEAHQWRGEAVQAQVCGLLALQMIPEGTSLWFAAAGTLASISARLGNRRLLQRTSEMLLRAPPGGEACSGARAIALSQAALQLLFDGCYDQARDLLAELPRVPSPDSPAVAAWIYRARAQLASAAGDVQGGVRFTEAAIEQHLRAGDLRNACNQLANAGSSRNEVGCYEQAEQLLREAIAVAERLGVRPALATAKLNLGLSLAMQGRLDEALAAEREAIATLEAMGHRRLLAGARAYASTILLLQGNAEEAEREALAALEAGGDAPTERLGALAALASALLAQKRPKEALDQAQQAIDGLSALGALDEGESPIRLVYAECLAAAGRPLEAHQAIRDARDRLLRRAATINDPTLRQSFLERARPNARTLSLARRWLAPG